jgi:hypothetical protein
MSNQFNRSVTIKIGKVGAFGEQYSGFRTHFTITKTSTTTPNEAKVEIYNLSPASRKFIDGLSDSMAPQAQAAKDELLFVTAGYKGNEKQIFVGNFVLATNEIKHPEAVTTIEASDGLITMNQIKFSEGQALSYGENTSAIRVIKDIIKRTGLVTTTFNWQSVPDYIYKKGFSFVGNARALLSTVCSVLGLEWSIQNGQLNLIPLGGTNGKIRVVSLSPENGLLDSPQHLQDVSNMIYSKMDKRALVGKSITASGQIQRNRVLGGLKIRSLLRPEIEPGSVIELSCKDIDPPATFRVVEVVHEGDTHGPQWETNSTVMRVRV